MRILEELYCGGIDPCNAGQPSALRENLRKLVTTNNQRMLTMLTNE